LSASGDDFDVVPTGVDKKSYPPNDKLKLIKRFTSLEGEARTEMLRKYGLYESDFSR